MTNVSFRPIGNPERATLEAFSVRTIPPDIRGYSKGSPRTLPVSVHAAILPGRLGPHDSLPCRWKDRDEDSEAHCPQIRGAVTPGFCRSRTGFLVWVPVFQPTGLRRPVALADGREVRAALDDEEESIDREPLRGDFHLRAEARIRAGLRRPVSLPGGREVPAELDDQDAALATLTALFEPGYVVTED
jgi:hypothetical protein